MNDEELLLTASAKRLRFRPMRGAKEIQNDVRHGSRGGHSGIGGSLPLYPPFRTLAGPSYR